MGVFAICAPFIAICACPLPILGLVSFVFQCISAFSHAGNVCRGAYVTEGDTSFDDYLEKDKGQFIFTWLVFFLCLPFAVCGLGCVGFLLFHCGRAFAGMASSGGSRNEKPQRDEKPQKKAPAGRDQPESRERTAEKKITEEKHDCSCSEGSV